MGKKHLRAVALGAALACLLGMAALGWAAGGPENAGGAGDPYYYYRNQNMWEARTGVQWMDQNQDGVVDYVQNSGLWGGAGFGDWVDANGDGICDNFADRPLDGTGNGWKGGH